MPPKAIPKNQLTLTSLFSKKDVKGTETVTELNIVTTNPEDEELVKFYASLGPKERQAHEIAKTALGMSYDVRRTRGFAAYSAQLLK
jgi:hypothetical protein